MVQFFVDKGSKIPLYMQLMDEIKFYISTGVLGEGERLPPVKELGKKLGISFLTVRKTYKELETAGLLDVRHGAGTFISLTGKRRTTRQSPDGHVPGRDLRERFAAAARLLFEQHLRQGLAIDEARQIAEQVFAELARKNAQPRVVFAECSRLHVDQISAVLRAELKVDVEPVLIDDIPSNLPRWVADGREINIITTGFHVDRVRKALGDSSFPVDVLITNLDPETRRQIEAIGERASYAFICRDKESAAVYKVLLRDDLGYKDVRLVTCTLSESSRVRSVIDSSDVILVSPMVYEEVRAICPPEKPMFSVFDRVDPMSLRVIRRRILAGR